MSHICKGITYSLQNSLFLMFVNHLLFRKRRGELFRKGKRFSLFCRRERYLLYSRHYSPPPPTTKPFSSAATQPPKETPRKQATIWGSLQLKVRGFFDKRSGFSIFKILEKHLLIYFLQYGLSLFLEPQLKPKTKQKCCLVLPGYMQKVKKSMDFMMKKAVVKFAGRSKKFAKLAANTNICIVLENERSFKKLFVKTKIV